jgi:NAD(P)-dependent dehydrogenase (short-subunit alcohol dehydrogenase family)
MAAPVECAHENDVRYLFDVNYFGALKAVQAAIPYLKQSGGSIVLVSSVGGQLPIVFDSFYSSSKAALEMLARGLYGELKHYRIRVTAVLPGGTATAFTYKRKVYPDEENGSYSQDVKKAVAALANIEQGGMAAGEVAEAIYQCVVSEHPPVVKVCGAKNAFYVTMGKLSPQKVTLYLNQRMYNV